MFALDAPDSATGCTQRWACDCPLNALGSCFAVVAETAVSEEWHEAVPRCLLLPATLTLTFTAHWPVALAETVASEEWHEASATLLGRTSGSSAAGGSRYFSLAESEFEDAASELEPGGSQQQCVRRHRQSSSSGGGEVAARSWCGPGKALFASTAQCFIPELDLLAALPCPPLPCLQARSRRQPGRALRRPPRCRWC